MIENPPHPAKFSKDILSKIDHILEAYQVMSLLDNFGGTCRIFDVCSPFIVANEIEWEWLVQGHQGSPWHGTHCIQGDACQLPFKDGSFQGVATSCTYGNRMADSHDAREMCKTCNGTGWYLQLAPMQPLDPFQPVNEDKVICPKCKGQGHNTYKRMTYKHQLGRDLHFNNSGQMQWGKTYREFHEQAWWEVRRVLTQPTDDRDGGLFILNVSDHIRNREVQPVCEWHVETITLLGFMLIEEHKIETARMRMGANYEARVDYEMVYVFRKV